MRLIDADNLLELFNRLQNLIGEYCECFKNESGALSVEWSCVESAVENAPTIEAEPVRHGRWKFEFKLAGSNFYRCSECNRQEVLLAKEDVHEYFPYCHCGAKMDLEE